MTPTPENAPRDNVREMLAELTEEAVVARQAALQASVDQLHAQAGDLDRAVLLLACSLALVIGAVFLLDRGMTDAGL